MLGCYRPEYIKASFKGFEFEAMDTSVTVGRRGALGEFPFGETTAYADMGRKIRKYNLKARFATSDHMSISQAFLAVCESSGPGTLAHPTAGIVNAACITATSNDNPIEGQGVTYVTLEFVEAYNFLGVLSDILIGVDTSPLLVSATDIFNTNFGLDHVNIFNTADTITTVSEVVVMLRDKYKSTLGSTTDVSKWHIVADYNRVIRDDALILDTQTIRNLVVNGSVAIASNVSGADKFDLFRSIVNNTGTVVSLSNSGASENALSMLIRTTALINMVQGAIESDETHIVSALNRVDVISNLVEQEFGIARVTCENAYLVQLQRYNANTQALLMTNAYKLPAIVQYDYQGPAHSLAAAWELYGDATQSRMLETQNPGLLPWGFGPSITAIRV